MKHVLKLVDAGLIDHTIVQGTQTRSFVWHEI